MGIIPMLELIKAVLSSRSSSVQSASVLWINDGINKFDLAYGELEKQFNKHKRKLDISCVLIDELETESFQSNNEIDEAIPTFEQKTMAILAGPSSFMEKMKQYLQTRKYPDDCVCFL